MNKRDLRYKLILTYDIQSSAQNLESCGFTLPQGERMLALWNDDSAVDDDPGIASTITIPGFSGWRATAVDVLNGVEQELMTRSDQDRLIVDGFLIKDYPILIQLSK